MKVAPIEREARLASRRGSVVVCITLESQVHQLEGCLRSVLAHTPEDVPVVLLDSAPAQLDAVPDIAGQEQRKLYWLGGEGAPFAIAAQVSEPADLVLVPSSCRVASGWLEGLRAAAYSDSRVATATAVCVEDGELERAAEAVPAQSPRLRPPLMRPGRCVLVRRSAIELVGCPADGLAGFAEACVRTGLSHVLADDVPVECLPGEWASAVVARAQRTLKGISVIVDARILDKPTSGVQLHVLETIAALSRTGEVRLSALVPANLDEIAESALRSLASVELVNYEQLSGPSAARADVVHRPVQFSNPGDLAFLAPLGERLIVTQHDLIGYHNPSYLPSPEAWRGYRELTRMALGTADRVVFLSNHARDEALAEELVVADRVSVVPNGVDHQLAGGRGQESTQPALLSGLPADAEMMLCLGNDYRHKNRLFALRMLERLHADQAWMGYLVLAGPHVADGSSATDEAEWLATRPALARFVLNLGAVSEPEKRWLLEHSRVVLYPTVYEGFGLIPFEAAEHGTPCAWAPGTSLSELLPDYAAAIVPWNVEQSAARTLELLRSERARKQNIEAIRAAAAGLTWDASAARLLEVYEAACDAPPTYAGTLARQQSSAAAPLSEDALRLVGPGGALPAEVERPLLAVATHPRIGGPVFGALKLGYRISHRLRRARAHSRR